MILNLKVMPDVEDGETVLDVHAEFVENEWEAFNDLGQWFLQQGECAEDYDLMWDGVVTYGRENSGCKITYSGERWDLSAADHLAWSQAGYLFDAPIKVHGSGRSGWALSITVTVCNRDIAALFQTGVAGQGHTSSARPPERAQRGLRLKEGG